MLWTHALHRFLIFVVRKDWWNSYGLWYYRLKYIQRNLRQDLGYSISLKDEWLTYNYDIIRKQNGVGRITLSLNLVGCVISNWKWVEIFWNIRFDECKYRWKPIRIGSISIWLLTKKRIGSREESKIKFII